MSDAIQKKVKLIMACIIFISIIIAYLVPNVEPLDINSIEATKRGIFVLAIEKFFQEKHKLPKTALELEQFSNRHLKDIVQRDQSIPNRLIGRYFGWDHPVNGYGKSYDDFDKYSPKIQILGRQVLILGCQNKILYHFDKEQNNFLVMTCRGDQLTGDVDSIKNEHKKSIFSHPEKGFRIENSRISTSGGSYINKNTYNIITDEFFDSETKAGRIAKSDWKNWVDIYSD